MTVKTNLDRRLQRLEEKKGAQKVIFLWDEPLPAKSDDDTLFIRFKWAEVAIPERGDNDANKST